MTFEEAIAAQPAWVGIWLNVLLFGAFILPVSLLIWKQTRLTAVITVIASIIGAVSTAWLFGQMGYVKLLGLPHIIVWTPLVIYLYRQQARGDMPVWPRRIIWVVMTTILISLAFDYTDVARYVLGEREAFSLG